MTILHLDWISWKIVKIRHYFSENIANFISAQRPLTTNNTGCARNKEIHHCTTVPKIAARDTFVITFPHFSWRYNPTESGYNATNGFRICFPDTIVHPACARKATHDRTPSAVSGTVTRTRITTEYSLVRNSLMSLFCGPVKEVCSKIMMVMVSIQRNCKPGWKINGGRGFDPLEQWSIPSGEVSK